MEKLARKLQKLGWSAVALCLTATFGLSATGSQPVDRASRQQQRSRTQRHPRHRVCPGVSHGTCTVSAAFAKANLLSEPIPAPISPVVRPVFRPVGAVIFPALAPPGQTVAVPSTLPRPPPLSA